VIELKSNKIAEILGYNKEVFEADIVDVSTDSRTIDSRSLFVAIRGEKFDGHNFIKDVLEKGAPLVVAEFLPDGVDASKVIVVDDTLKALGKIANYNRRQFKGKVIALTGSSGKTTTKEELKVALSSFGKTYATKANFNNHIGVPRSLLDIDMSAEYVIIEMGMSAPNEIRQLVEMTEPDMAVVTNVLPMHIEFLGSIENIARAKAEIFSGLKKDGVAIFNQDTNCADILRAEALRFTTNVLEYGEKNHVGAEFEVEDEARHSYYNGWAVLEVVKALGLDVNIGAKAISGFGALEGRGKKYNLEINGKKVVLIDNSYSAGPDATVLAVESLGKMKNLGRKIALIGKMAELGDYTVEAHKRVGVALQNNNIDVVIGVCEETKIILAELGSEVEKYYFDNIEGLSEFLLSEILRDGDVILIKGSHYSSQVYKVANDLKVA
jgi:UDP-N-acetylmuramoyl-tripeptide--D-alanyl-D-alanine ligase